MSFASVLILSYRFTITYANNLTFATLKAAIPK